MEITDSAKMSPGKPGLAYGRIGVLMGGPSSEREISFKSGKAVLHALIGLGLEAVAIDIQTDSAEQVMAQVRAAHISVAFIALHGRFGEDGQIQAILESLHIAYTGSGVKASKLALDKIASRALFSAGGISTPQSRVVVKGRAGAYDELARALGLPLVIKPATGGSSIGLSIVDEEASVPAAMERAFKYDDAVVVEEYIKGRELTVGILDKRALPVIEIITKNRFFDYEAKYEAGKTEYIVPAVLDEQLVKGLQDAACSAHALLGCAGCSRADFILTPEGRPYILEVNTIPGFTATSLLPKAARVVGLEFPQLCLRLIELAYEKAQTESAVAQI